MKKIYLFLAIVVMFCANACGNSFEDNLKTIVKERTGEETQILSVDKFKSLDNLMLAVLQDKEGASFPLFVSKSGTSFLSIPQFFHFSDDSDTELLKKRFGEIEEINKKAKAGKLDALFDSLPDNASVLLSAKNKTDALLTIVSDPDCPYCREELKKLKEHLETTNVKIVLAPVHDETAFLKSALIMQEASKFNSSETDKIIAVFEKYYQNAELSDEQKKISTTAIHDNARAIFNSRLITGVPYLHTGKLK